MLQNTVDTRPPPPLPPPLSLLSGYFSFVFFFLSPSHSIFVLSRRPGRHNLCVCVCWVGVRVDACSCEFWVTLCANCLSVSEQLYSPGCVFTRVNHHNATNTDSPTAHVPTVGQRCPPPYKPQSQDTAPQGEGGPSARSLCKSRVHRYKHQCCKQ